MTMLSSQTMLGLGRFVSVEIRFFLEVSSLCASCFGCNWAFFIWAVMLLQCHQDIVSMLFNKKIKYVQTHLFVPSSAQISAKETVTWAYMHQNQIWGSWYAYSLLPSTSNLYNVCCLALWVQDAGAVLNLYVGLIISWCKVFDRND